LNVTMFRSGAAVALALVLAAAPVAAQVGYPPGASPYRDLEFHQQATLFTGWYAAQSDPAGVAPQSGPMLGLRYDVQIGGPAQFTARLATVRSERTVINPALPPATRVVGTRSWPLYTADASLSVNLTGQKSWRKLVPLLNAGIGVVSDMKGGTDVGNYKFGTSFAFDFGGGVRYVPGGNFQLRADVADYIYQIQYPADYTLSSTSNGSSPVIASGKPTGYWRHNLALTLGASYQFFR
jgi:hypothetical protein